MADYRSKGRRDPGSIGSRGRRQNTRGAHGTEETSL